jgi:hypothetical protein
MLRYHPENTGKLESHKHIQRMINASSRFAESPADQDITKPSRPRNRILRHLDPMSTKPVCIELNQHMSRRESPSNNPSRLPSP